jgi:MFS family permease
MAIAIEQGRAMTARRVRWQVICAYWLAQYAAWLALLTPVVITIAVRLGHITDQEHKASWLGWIMGVGAMAAMIAAPIWGTISDRTRSRIGKRKLWVIIGAISLLAGLLIMALARDPLIFGLGWLVCQIGSNAAQAALNAVLSDIFPEAQRGAMSALLGTAATTAMMTGVFLTRFTIDNPFAMFLVPWLLTPVAVALFVAIVPDSPAPEHTAERQPRRRWRFRNPLVHADFTWAFVSRFMVTLAYSFSMTYQVYFLTDHLRIRQDQIAYFMSISVSVVGVVTLIVSCVGGWLSDRAARRKPFVVTAAAIMACGLVGVAMADDFSQVLWAVGLVSLGQGLYYAVDLALCVEVLPDRSDAARDMAVMQIASSLPQSLAPAIAPFVLAVSAEVLRGANYPLLFCVAAAIALVGAITIAPIRRVR